MAIAFDVNQAQRECLGRKVVVWPDLDPTEVPIFVSVLHPINTLLLGNMAEHQPRRDYCWSGTAGSPKLRKRVHILSTGLCRPLCLVTSVLYSK